MIDKKNELVKAALIIYEHCEKNKCETCPFLLVDPDDPDDTFGYNCRLDAGCPAYWDVSEKLIGIDLAQGPDFTNGPGFTNEEADEPEEYERDGTPTIEL